MIKVPFSGSVQNKVESSSHLTAGLALIKSWTDSLVIPDHIVPIIAGGAVRDVFFKDTTPHDVDIFFVSGTDARQPPRDVLGNILLESLLMWFEDQDITWRSLTRQQREAYENNNQFSYAEIFEFEMEGITYQLMVPSSVPSMDGLIDRFPVMCKVALNHEGLYFTLPGFAAMSYNIPVGYNLTDYNYLCKKHEDEEVSLFGDVTHMFNIVVNKLWSDLGHVTRTHRINRNVAYSAALVESRPDTIPMMCRRLVRERFNIPNTDILDNVSPQLFSQYSRSRRRLPETSSGTISGTVSARNAIADFAGQFSSLATSASRFSFN